VDIWHQASRAPQNLTSSGVGYFTVNPELGEGAIDWKWFESEPAVREAGGVRLIRLPQPLVVKIDGRARRGVIREIRE